MMVLLFHHLVVVGVFAAVGKVGHSYFLKVLEGPFI